MANDSARCNGSHSRSRHTHLQRALTASPPPQVTQTPGNGVGEAVGDCGMLTLKRMPLTRIVTN